MRSALLLVLVFVSICLQTKAADTTVVQSQAITVELYNQNGGGEDSVPIRIRDVDSNKIAQISVQKKRGNENIWDGFFRIQFFAGDNASRVLEFLGTDKKPYFVYFVREDNLQKVKLFTSAEELAKQIDKDVTLRPEEKAIAKSADPQKVELASPEKIMKLEAQAPAVAVPAVPSVSLEELEARRKSELLAQEEKLTLAQKAANKEKAQELAKKADGLYKKRDFKGAEKLYSQAIDLDPENNEFNYRYGVSLYKNLDYNKSLLNLSIAEVPEELLLEKDYYIALNHLKLKDYDKALKGLLEVRDEENPDISPTASFMAGTIQYQRQDFAEARKSMEFVLDKSHDPKMDKAAEEMLEQIDKMENFVASKKERYRFTFFAGPVYDENVLNLAANNVSTDVQAIRANYGLSALGIWYRTLNSDLGTQLSISDYYSTNTKLQGDATLQAADPLELSISVPYHQEFTVGARSLNWELLPQAKSIYMSAAGGARQELIRSYGVSTTAATPFKRDLYFSTKLEAFSDTSYLSSSTGDDSQSGTKYGVTFSPTKLLDLKGEKSLSADFSYNLNNADGKNYRYSRLGIGVSYGAPFIWNSNGTLRLDYGSQNYGEAATPRTDTTYALSGILSKEIAKNWNFTSTMQYTVASSDLDLYKYNKLMVMGLFTYTLSVQGK